MRDEFGLVIDLFYILSSTNEYFFTLFIMVQKFMKNISSKHKKKYINDEGGGVFSKQKVRNKYNSRYQLTHSKRYFVIKNDFIKDTRTSWTYSERKINATSYVLITGSPYCDAEGYPQLRSCLHDAIVNASPRIVGKFTNQNYIDNVHL